MPRTAEGFKQLYKAFCQARGHVAPPMWRPVMVMMLRHRLLAGFKPKAKSQEGWRWGALLVAVLGEGPRGGREEEGGACGEERGADRSCGGEPPQGGEG